MVIFSLIPITLSPSISVFLPCHCQEQSTAFLIEFKKKLLKQYCPSLSLDRVRAGTPGRSIFIWWSCLMSELLFDQDIWCVYASISQQKIPGLDVGWEPGGGWLGPAWWDHTTLMALELVRDFTNRQMGGNAFKIEFLTTTPTPLR